MSMLPADLRRQRHLVLRSISVSDFIEFFPQDDSNINIAHTLSGSWQQRADFGEEQRASAWPSLAR